jgi:organic hydroperoxide reductase OsmC/OhrA
MDWEPVKYPYSTSLKWTGEHKGVHSSEGKPDIPVACPPEWGGHPNIWSPEDLFVASVELCTMTTFLFLLDKTKGKIKSYESTAVGTAQMVDGVFVFRDIVVRPKIVAPSGENADKAAKALADCPKWCLITRSVKCDVKIEPDIKVG